MRKAFDFRILLITIAVSGLIPAAALAFGLSENESFREEVRLAISRAKDFKRTQERFKEQEIEHEKDAEQASRDRAKFDEYREHERERYVDWRAKQPDPTLEAERRDKIHQAEVDKEDAQMEKNRKRFVEKREIVRGILEKEGHVDGDKEYGLKYEPELLVHPGIHGGVHGSQDATMNGQPEHQRE